MKTFCVPLLLEISLLTFAAPAGAIVLINNGLTSANPGNVIDELIEEEVRVQNVGCDASVQDLCPMPWGDPTSVELVDGGTVGSGLIVFESSTVTASGGAVPDGFVTFDSASVTMSGGTVTNYLRARDSSDIRMSGGTVGGQLYADDSSTLTIVGSGFEVDRVPVDEGPIEAMSGVLTGTLESGDPIDNFFCHSGATPQLCGDTYSGLITLVPEPDRALLLLAVLLSLAVARAPRGSWRFSTPAATPSSASIRRDQASRDTPEHPRRHTLE